MEAQFERHVFDNTDKGIKQLIRWIKKVTGKAFEHIQICLEATGVYHLSVTKALYDKRCRVCVINPLQAYHYAKGLGMRAKTDRLDSMMLTRLSAEREPSRWQPAPKELNELKALNIRLDAIEKDIRREQNRLESASLADYSKVVVRQIERSICWLEQEVEKLVLAIDELITKQEGLKKNRELLLSIKGIGDVTSRYLLAEIYEGRFQSASQCAAYMGLVPVPQQSGKFERTSLSRAGNRRLKAKLYMAAISAKQHNPILKEHYDRLIARGKSKMTALCAVMRRLVQICFGVIKHQTPFCLQA
jgi:transposase